MDRVSQAQTKLEKGSAAPSFSFPVFLLEVRAQRATRETEALRAISTGRLLRRFALWAAPGGSRVGGSWQTPMLIDPAQHNNTLKLNSPNQGL